MDRMIDFEWNINKKSNIIYEYITISDKKYNFIFKSKPTKHTNKFFFYDISNYSSRNDFY